MHAKRFEELKATGLLPSPTGVGLEILRLTREDKASADEIAEIIQTDPALTGRTLKLANTGNAAASRPVTIVADAVARLGTRTVTAVALGFTILAGNRSGKCRGFDYQKFWSHSLAFAVAAQILSAHTKRHSRSEAFTAGLLSQIGRLALASIHPEKYALILAEWDSADPLELAQMEQRAFVTDHNELSAVMLDDWGLPQTVSDAVWHQDDPSNVDLCSSPETQQFAHILHTSSRMADICVAPTDTHAAAFASDLLGRCEEIGIDAESMIALFDRVFTQWAEWGRVLEIATQRPPKLAELIEAGHSVDSTLLKTTAPQTSMPSIPIYDARPPAIHAVHSETDDRQYGLLVLVADQDAASLRFLEKFLVLSGHRVRCATSGREALQTFFETAPQLVVVDATLPEISGLELCRRLRQTAAGRQAYIIMITPPNDEEILVRLFEAGVDDFVTKPFSARPLFARIRASLRVVALQERVNLDREEIQRVHSELAIAHRRLEQDALTDVLTGLPNRRYLIDRLAHDWAAARRGGTPLACMVVDIDNFKTVNDTYGHDVGDAVLQAVASVLQREVRGTDVVCRFGGEEFVVVSAADFDSAMRCAERLREGIESQLAGQLTPGKEPVTVSIGVAVRNDQTRSPEALIKVADEALFRAKRSGRNRVAGTREHGNHPARLAENGSPTTPPATSLLDTAR